ncbi:T-complex 1 subunit beta [Labeo rohita]|uniref:T-complex 1 subunit beta n=1 Tax=Labeo rohita TaxID=84645 RepID=A0A498NY94_LABRO|nr:T-complex 1 subunit beta [Labeo rohita]
MFLTGFLLDKRIGVNQPKRIENANILIANTGMDTDKIKIFGSRVRVDSTAKVAEIEMAEKEKMKEKFAVDFEPLTSWMSSCVSTNQISSPGVMPIVTQLHNTTSIWVADPKRGSLTSWT